MRIRINHIVQVSKTMRRAIAWHLGREGEMASIEEIKTFLREREQFTLEKAIDRHQTFSKMEK